MKTVFFLTLFIILSVFVNPTLAKNLPTTEQFQGILQSCAIGANIKISADLVGSITKIYEGDRTQGKVSMATGTDFLKLIPEKDRLKVYELYNSCIKNFLSSSVSAVEDTDIYQVELDGLRKDNRFRDELMEYVECQIARTSSDDNNKTCNDKYKEEKFSCEKLVGARSSSNYPDNNAQRYEFRKIHYKDKKGGGIVKSCRNVNNILPAEAKYYYYVSIGYHMLSDYENTMVYLNKAASLGSIDAMRKLGIIYEIGSIAEKNNVLAKKWFIKAANNSDVSAQEILNYIGSKQASIN